MPILLQLAPPPRPAPGRRLYVLDLEPYYLRPLTTKRPSLYIPNRFIVVRCLVPYSYLIVPKNEGNHAVTRARVISDQGGGRNEAASVRHRLNPEMQRVLVFSSPSRVRVRMSRVRVRVQMRRTRVRVRVQQVSSPSPSPGFCVSSPNPSPEEKNWRALARGIFHIPWITLQIRIYSRLLNLLTTTELQ